MSAPVVVTCEHGIRQYVRRGLEPDTCSCDLVFKSSTDIKERPVVWPWLYGRAS
jgi:hypothetical protein